MSELRYFKVSHNLGTKYIKSTLYKRDLARKIYPDISNGEYQGPRVSRFYRVLFGGYVYVTELLPDEIMLLEKVITFQEI